ncbi:MAG: hypothetical protein BWY99_01525 [Synergistetes bacterium ADurb.BinA166]|nr:MAG: hypothetical protein BWY99_01525 [Synergistetes bacterium ADurb.BinA166]
MKGLLAIVLRLLMEIFVRMTASPRRKAAKSIVRVEREGGYALRCGCLVHVSSEDLRRMMERFGPEVVLDVEKEVRRTHEHERSEPASTAA